MDLSKLVPAKALAEHLNCSVNTIRNATKKGLIPGAVKVLGRWGYDLDVSGTWEVPPKQVFGAGRADGRYVYRIWLTPDEAQTLTEAGYSLTRANKGKKAKATAAQEGYEGEAALPAAPAGPPQAVETDEESDDPFAAFGV